MEALAQAASERPAGYTGAGLTPADAAAIDDLVAGLRRDLEDTLRRVSVFGSKIRGQAGAESDIDVLVIVRSSVDRYRTVWSRVADIAWQVEQAHGVVLSLVLKTEAEFERMSRAGLLLAMDIERDGVTVWTATTSAATYASA